MDNEENIHTMQKHNPRGNKPTKHKRISLKRHPSKLNKEINVPQSIEKEQKSSKGTIYPSSKKLLSTRTLESVEKLKPISQKPEISSIKDKDMTYFSNPCSCFYCSDKIMKKNKNQLLEFKIDSNPNPIPRK